MGGILGGIYSDMERRYGWYKIQQHRPVALLHETLGGMDVTVKCSKKDLELPRDLEKTTARPIIDAFKNYLLHRANEYYAVLPYIYYIVSSYNPAKGLYYCPPSKASDYDTVPEVLKHMYEAQSELLHREVLTSRRPLHQQHNLTGRRGMWSHIVQTTHTPPDRSEHVCAAPAKPNSLSQLQGRV